MDRGLERPRAKPFGTTCQAGRISPTPGQRENNSEGCQWTRVGFTPSLIAIFNDVA